MKKTISSRKGFTLLELLIVVAVIGLLAAIAIPVFSQYRVRGYNANAAVDLSSARDQIEIYYTEHLRYP